MKDILNRDVSLGDLVLAYPGVDYFSNAKYCIVTGSNRVFNGVEAFTTSKCIKIGALTPEQELIKQELMTLINAYNQSKIVSNANKIVPVPGGVYAGDSSQYCYLYLGRYKLESNQKGKNTNQKWPVNYDDGGYCYLKFPKNNRMAENFLKKYLNSSINAVDFNLFMGDYNNFQYMLTSNYNSLTYELSNFVISSRKRTFEKELGKIKIGGLGKEMLFDIRSLKHATSQWYINRYILDSAYVKLIPIK